MVIGDPVEHSLSPMMHNQAYEALGIDDKFVFLAARVKIQDIKEILNTVRILGIRGLSCTAPHKIEIIKYLDKKYIDPVARKIGAVNTVVNDDGVLRGYNYDWLGILKPLEKITNIEGAMVAILGAGGLARACAYAVSSRGANFTIYNRTLSHAVVLANEFGGKGKSFDEIEEVKNADIILNATILGMQPKIDGTPLPAEFISKNQIVFDAVYSPYETRLLRDAKNRGAKVIHGLEMLLYQGMPQFELYTGRPAPVDAMRKVLETFNCHPDRPEGAEGSHTNK